MVKFPESFDKTEGAILNALYEAPNGAHTSYSLATQLYPDAKISTPEALAAFVETRAGTERLMVRGIVDAKERNSGADGVYFNKLRLTKKGEKAAIQHRTAPAKTGMTEEEREASRKVIEKLKDSK
jgi:hypothetical protein